MVLQKRCVLVYLFLVLFANCFLCVDLGACFVPYPSSAHYPAEGVICAFYNLSSWDVKILPLGEPITPWISFGTASKDRAVYPSANDPLLLASRSLKPHAFAVYFVPIAQLSGFKLHVITKGGVIEAKFCDDCLSQYCIFVLHQHLVHVDGLVLEVQGFLDVHGLSDCGLIQFGERGVQLFRDAAGVQHQFSRRSDRQSSLASFLVSRRMVE